jgi:CRISPR-associated protein Csm3
MKLVGKILIQGKLTTKTGLHVGGSKSSLSIGGMDNAVIKSAKGQPYVPGSSIKGKLRSLLAKTEGSYFFSKKAKEGEQKRVERLNGDRKEEAKSYLNLISSEKISTDEDHQYIMDLFGYSGDSNKPEERGIRPNRLLVRDAFLVNADDSIFFEGYTDSKWENVINRRTGTAEHPRQMERVPAGAQFQFELVYSVYDDVTGANQSELRGHLQKILMALQLLEDDGIGGQLSRGYGKVNVSVTDIIPKFIDPENYTYQKLEQIDDDLLGSATKQLLDRFSNELSTS